MFVIKYRKIFFILSALFVLGSLVAVFVKGVPLGIEFSGGSIMEFEYLDDGGVEPTISEIKTALEEAGFTSSQVQKTDEHGYIVRTKILDEEAHAELKNVVSMGSSINEQRFNEIGPVIGEELRVKAMVSILLVVLAIVLFIAFAFRHVSKPVSSWKYGLVAIVALLHDIIIPVGVFVMLADYVIGAEVDVLFVTALLAILGFSVNDTIVVFDRVRENLKLNKENGLSRDFAETVGDSLTQTYVRSINTSVTTLFVLLTLFFVGGESTKYFALVLAIGVVAGTYSSIFLASPLLVVLSGVNEE